MEASSTMSNGGDGNEHHFQKEDVALTAQENRITEPHFEILPGQIRSIHVARKMCFLTAMSGELT
jgi:hypothetical protein